MIGVSRPYASPPRDGLCFRGEPTAPPGPQHAARRAAHRAMTPPAKAVARSLHDPIAETPVTTGYRSPGLSSRLRAPTVLRPAGGSPPSSPPHSRAVPPAVLTDFARHPSAAIADAPSLKQAQDDRRFLLDLVGLLQRSVDPAVITRAVTSAPGFTRAAPLVIAAPELFGGSAASAASVKLTHSRTPAPAPRRRPDTSAAVATPAATTRAATGSISPIRDPAWMTRHPPPPLLSAQAPPSASPFVSSNYAAGHQLRRGVTVGDGPLRHQQSEGSSRWDQRGHKVSLVEGPAAGRGPDRRRAATEEAHGVAVAAAPPAAAASDGAAATKDKRDVQALLATAASLQSLSEDLHRQAMADAPLTQRGGGQTDFAAKYATDTVPSQYSSRAHQGGNNGYSTTPVTTDRHAPSLGVGANKLLCTPSAAIGGPVGPSAAREFSRQGPIPDPRSVLQDRPSTASLAQRWAGDNLRDTAATETAPIRPPWDTYRQ